jgi:3-oxoacyl-[acyl-carrier-protein] synthase II
MIIGGADSIVNPEEIGGFNEIYALSLRNETPATASRPFTADRDGFVIGEGAGIMILEAEETARARGAAILAEMAGYAVTSEAYNMMSPMKDGEGMARTMALALRDARVGRDEVDYINAHGTSTPLNDKYETAAIKKVFEARARDIPVSSSKSMIGHTIGAAGVIEGGITVMSIAREVLTPTINFEHPDPELDLDYVPNVARPWKIRAALSNSFAFGGHNATLVFRKHGA